MNSSGERPLDSRWNRKFEVREKLIFQIESRLFSPQRSRKIFISINRVILVVKCLYRYSRKCFILYSYSFQHQQDIWTFYYIDGRRANPLFSILFNFAPSINAYLDLNPKALTLQFYSAFFHSQNSHFVHLMLYISAFSD